MKGKTEGFVREIALGDELATKRLGAQIAAGLKSGETVALWGDLGTGKTTLARAILCALGVREAVPSPTFTLVQHYDTPRLPVDHFDLYRIERESDIEQLGLGHALASGAALIEWPERAGSQLPSAALHVAMDIVGEGSRRATVSGPARWAAVFSEAQ
jgi:tRNA threonylcarbamoyl adenosine modification protein YjeE